MTINDSCQCGAELTVSIGNGFGSTPEADARCKTQHDHWLEAHAGCRAHLGWCRGNVDDPPVAARVTDLERAFHKIIAARSTA